MKTKAHKERINVTVDPDIHQAFAETAKRDGFSVSAILNTAMGMYVHEAATSTPGNPITRKLLDRLGENSAKADFSHLAGKIAEQAGFSPCGMGDSKPDVAKEIPSNKVDAWFRETDGGGIGLKIAPELYGQHDSILGQALMMRAKLKCNTVHIVVPYIAGTNKNFCETLRQVGLSIIPIDTLAMAISSNSSELLKAGNTPAHDQIVEDTHQYLPTWKYPNEDATPSEISSH